MKSPSEIKKEKMKDIMLKLGYKFGINKREEDFILLCMEEQAIEFEKRETKLVCDMTDRLDKQAIEFEKERNKLKPNNVIGMTNKEYDYFKEGVEKGKQQQAQEFQKKIKKKKSNNQFSQYWLGYNDALQELLKEVQGEGK